MDAGPFPVNDVVSWYSTDTRRILKHNSHHDSILEFYSRVKQTLHAAAAAKIFTVETSFLIR